MPRTTTILTIICAASLLGNVWLYRALKGRQMAAPEAVAAPQPQAPSVSRETKLALSSTANAALGVAKPTAKQVADKCKKKFEDEFRRQLRDPTEREKLKRQEILSLQAINVGAASRLHLNEQAFARIIELQADQNLVSREAAIGTGGSLGGVPVNPQIADEFGESIASKWVEYAREYSGRAAVHGVSNLFADANVPLSEDQRRRLVSVYADEFEMQSAQDSAPDMHYTPGDKNPRAMGDYLQKLVARQVAFDQRVQADAASFLTAPQLELLRKKSDLDSERFRSVVETMPKTVDDSPEPAIEC
jgi:hypothetical protein